MKNILFNLYNKKLQFYENGFLFAFFIINGNIKDNV